MVDLLLGRVLPWLLVGLGTGLLYWLGFNLVQQLGKILLRLEGVFQRLDAIEKRIGQPAGAAPQRRSALPAGSAAPEFELPDLAGVRRSLSEFRGRRVLLVFFSPRCGHCLKMIPNLTALPPEGGDGWPVPLLVSTGDADENRRLVEEHGIRCRFLLQEKMEVASEKYDVYGTPMGYLIDEEGKIVGEAGVGADALVGLAVAARATAAEQPTNGQADHGAEVKSSKGKANKGLAESRVNRSGLKAGTPAPGFRLPKLDGNGELSLDDYRGRRLLLVFSDPDCGPCDQLGRTSSDCTAKDPT